MFTRCFRSSSLIIGLISTLMPLLPAKLGMVRRALELHLIDELATSDEYIGQQCDEQDVFGVTWIETKKPLERLLDKANAALDRVNHMLEFVRR